MQIKSPKNFCAGLIFVAFGFCFMFVARNYQMGNATQMGPAYLPSVIGGLLALIGGIVFFQSFVVKGNKIPAMTFRPIFLISLSLLVFVYLLKQIGLVLALGFLVVVSAFAGHEFNLKEVLILYVALIIFSVLVFVKCFGLPFQLWPKFLI
jgi:hypothetical protein